LATAWHEPAAGGKETTTAEELYRQMLAIHPHRVNPGALWLSVQSAKAGMGQR